MTALIILPLSILYVYMRACSPFLKTKGLKILAFFCVAALAFSFPIGMSLVRLFEIKDLFPIRLTSFVFGTFAFSLLFLLVRDIITIVSFILSVTTGKARKTYAFVKSASSVYLAFLLAMCVTSVGVYTAIQVPDVNRVTINIEDLPEELEGFTIVQISDTHIGAGFDGPWLKEIVDKVNALNADLIVGTGDIVDASIGLVGNQADVLTELSAPYGVYFITGNHEYYAGVHDWLPYFENELGLNFLINESVVLDVDSAKLAILGLPDLRYYRAGGSEERDYEKLMKNLPEDAVTILLDHQPVAAEENAQYGFDVQLSGHTHGGQVTLLEPIVAAANGGYVSGLYDVDGMKLYVSRGTGLWGYASIRLFVPAEITLITLR